MGEIVNLRQARKARARADAGSLAAERRAAHGRTKGERAGQAADRARLERMIDDATLPRKPED